MNVSRTRGWAASAGAVLLAGLLAAPQGGAVAASSVDQQQTAFDAPFALSSAVSWAQVFTAGLGGQVPRLDVRVAKDPATTAPLTVELRTVSAGAPTATVLAASIVPAAEVADLGGDVPFESITFATPPVVNAGAQYALVVHNNGGPGDYAVGNANSDVYAAGAAYATGDSPPAASWTVQAFDMSFRTFVDLFDPACDANGAKTGFNVVRGTDGADSLVGTLGKDLIYGFGGDDVIRGRGGNDLICGGGGNDEVIAGDDGDVVFGGAGDDRIRGGGGHDRLSGGDGNDVITGGAGRDRLFGNGGSDVLRGNGGRDFLDGGTGADILRGGAGADTVKGGPGKDDVVS